MIEDKTEKKRINNVKIETFFKKYLKKISYRGIFGVAKFSSVYNNLIPNQQKRLKSILQSQFNEFLSSGSIISIGIFYHQNIIECINHKTNGKIDKESWNKYGEEYHHLNIMLKDISLKMAKKFGGYAIPPTTETPTKEVSNVTDYFPKTISHRFVAENAGIGWRGKNELLITKQFGPGVRLASILINIPLIQGEKKDSKCGACRECLDICKILDNKHDLIDYRENCRKYIQLIGLEHDVCGKCIKACIKNGIYKDVFINTSE